MREGNRGAKTAAGTDAASDARIRFRAPNPSTCIRGQVLSLGRCQKLLSGQLYCRKLTSSQL